MLLVLYKKKMFYRNSPSLPENVVNRWVSIRMLQGEFREGQGESWEGSGRVGKTLPECIYLIYNKLMRFQGERESMKKIYFFRMT